MKTGKQLAECAMLSGWDKFTYSHLDCQAFVEMVLKEIGVRKKDGSVYNWRGSNSMYRNYYSWRGTKEECINKFGKIPIGAFVYIWKETGDDYHDGLGNFNHVGIYCGNNIVRDSTRSTKTGRDGVGTRSIKDFTHVSLFSGIDYTEQDIYTDSDEVDEIINRIISEISKLRNYIKGRQ